MPHWKVMRGLVIVRAEDRERLVRALKEWTKEVYWWPITLGPRDLKRLTAAS